MAFFAVRLPKRVLDRMALKDLRRDFPRLRFENPLDLHLTLRFFPNGDAPSLEKIIRAMEKFETTVEAFELTTDGAYTFDHGAKGGILWLGLKEVPLPLVQLQTELEEFAQKLGFTAEARTFTPHITLLRYRGEERAEVKEAMRTINESPSFHNTFRVNGFRLMKRTKDLADQSYKDLLTVLTRQAAPVPDREARRAL